MGRLAATETVNPIASALEKAQEPALVKAGKGSLRRRTRSRGELFVARSELRLAGRQAATI
jgi:hypothetical protein